MAIENMENMENNVETWNGVTIEELRFMRASVLIRMEMQKEFLKKKARETLPGNMNSSGTLVSNISGKLTLAQKMILVFKGAKLAASIYSLFKRNKKR